MGVTPARAWVSCLLSASLTVACDEASNTSAPGPDASAVGASATAEAARLRVVTIERILRAEHRRTPAAVLPDDQQHRSAPVRRIAARALARIGGDAARAGLLRALSDEDPEVVRWAAYGLGFHCKDHRSDDVSALAARALSSPRSGFDEAFAAIARAIGNCGAETSEPTLSAWLTESAPRVDAVALGLGDLASLKKRLREDTLVALLNRAEGSAASPPVALAFFPFSRVDRVPPSVIGRLVEVASARLATRGEGRVLAIRALGRGGEAAAPALAKVLASRDDFDAAERTAAIASLARLEKAGQAALVGALGDMVPDPKSIPATLWGSEEVGVLLALLSAIEQPTKADKLLRQLAAIDPPASAAAPAVRRIAWVRCGAASRVVGGNYNDPLLIGCDLAKDDKVAIGERAIVEVLGRRKLTGREEQRWKELATSGPLRAREAALELATSHVELRDPAPVLAGALAADELGLVGVAAEAIAAQPLLAADERTRAKIRRSLDDEEDRPAADGKPKSQPGVATPAIKKALFAALDRSADDPEVQASVIAAVGALSPESATEKLEPFCVSSYPLLRERAESALFLITGKKRTCAPPEGGGSTAGELERELDTATTVRVVLESDAGELELTLRPDLAPVTVRRVVDLVSAGYYADNVVHRVVPGFVSQFGAPRGDGYGGPPGKPPLRCETSPESFAPYTVGVALAGRDTGSSQLFVTHATYPHLDGKYAWIGTAKGPWAALVDGDRLVKASIAAP